jgi:hypothetical protein
MNKLMIAGMLGLIGLMGACVVLKPVAPVKGSPVTGTNEARPWRDKPPNDAMVIVAPPELPGWPVFFLPRMPAAIVMNTNPVVLPTKLVYAFQFFDTRYTNLVGFMESSTDLRSTNWTRLTNFAYPTNGMILYGTNAFAGHEQFYVRAGYTIPKVLLP